MIPKQTAGPQYKAWVPLGGATALQRCDGLLETTGERETEKDVATLLDMLPGRDEEPVRLALQVAGRNHVHVAYGHVVDA